MRQYFINIIENNSQHIIDVLAKYGYNNVEITPELLLRAYEIHGEDFLSEIFEIQNSYYVAKPGKIGIDSWLKVNSASITTSAKEQGTADQTNLGLTEEAKKIVEDDDKKTFWERTKNVWDKALPLVNSTTGALNIIDSSIVNKKTVPDVPEVDSPKKDYTMYIIGGIIVVVVAVVLFFVFRKKVPVA